MGLAPWEDPHVLRWALFWGASIGALGALDYVRSTRSDGTTVSEILRAILSTHTPLGEAAFHAGLAVFARHILH